MEEEGWRRWAVLVATTWIQALTGTNLDFSGYSTQLKSAMGISQLQLSLLSIASDMGKAFGWCSGVSLRHMPLWPVVLLAALLSLLGYGLQWLLISDFISLPYFLVFFLCLLTGCSICWFNTICYVLCIRHFPSNRSLALSLSISFNGLTAAIYTLIVNTIDSTNDSLYLLLNAVVPLLTSLISMILITNSRHQPQPTLPPELASFTFVALYSLAILTGSYLLSLNSIHSPFVLIGALLLLFVVPLSMITAIYSTTRHGDQCREKIIVSFEDVNFNLVENLCDPHYELHKELIEPARCNTLLARDRIPTLGVEHSAHMLVRRCDFWVYYLAYLGGGTIGLAYSNNLGQIVQSLGFKSDTTFIVSVFSTASFFGRLLAAAPDFFSSKLWFARTGWLALAIVPTPVAFFLLVASGSWTTLCISTTLIGLSSGFVFAASVAVSSELFGPNSAGVNHNILITNIPIGSLLYGLLAALIYDAKAGSSVATSEPVRDTMVCMGRKCYLETFVWFGFFSSLGLVCSLLLFVRTKYAYDQYKRNRRRVQSLY